jgi:hypothetical protein
VFVNPVDWTLFWLVILYRITWWPGTVLDRITPDRPSVFSPPCGASTWQTDYCPPNYHLHALQKPQCRFRTRSTLLEGLAQMVAADLPSPENHYFPAFSSSAAAPSIAAAASSIIFPILGTCASAVFQSFLSIASRTAAIGFAP